MGRIATCADCGNPFQVDKRGPLPKRCPDHSSGYRNCDCCGKTWRGAIGNKTCVECQDRRCRWCGEPVDGARQFCNDTCLHESRRQARQVSCAHCGQQYARETGNQKYCSTRCRSRRARELFKERYPDEPPRKAKWTNTRKAAWQARRELKKAAQAGTAFTPAEIFEHDEWMCGCCGEPIDPQIQWPDKRCATVDHVIPLARGGEHSRDNVQAAHLSCNVAKSDSLPAAQVAPTE
jgi:hypothetical protein